MEQTRVVSLIEVCLNTALGFVVSFSAWPLVAALYSIPYSVHQNLGITGIFTVLSIARSYVVRRFFARKFHEAAWRLAKWL
jgi:predicted histidine transporter YuiF (NhaC family)